DRSAPSAILHDVDVAAVTQRLRTMLEIRNKDELPARMREEHAVEIKECLRLLDVLAEIPVEHLPAARSRSPRSIITQPGLRYAQACALIKSLMKEPLMKALPVGQRLAVIDRIFSEMQGRMLEDVILFETAIARPDKEVLKVQFAVGEFDMLVFDEGDVSCEIYEIKHSAKAAPEQRRHLLDGEKLELARFHYGRVKRRCVLYLGEPAVFDGIEYANAEDYLRALPHGERAASLARRLA
ncbi:MAG: ATP-binding protein, partial [Duodenibacillus sp.]|nr:ATP-binding protein [Duodenibacillus sp.]